ncbi:MAG TPA: hypothetical protein VJ698_03210 [Noviherbaspirillum sp.]|uniref:hypothetical protein n=1 Tax=Noviherbaspirillum sp. TaxID=1926288 RepID=UPI002B4A9AAA|nr:hypothetical protein [Noviherbaspirillum sp.]HJV84459.1 hypothetical protein [Noviherbaspirillum sp.]
MWDADVRNYLQRQLLHDRLLQQGDVYALYDFQTFTHNAVSMARRCGRVDRLSEIAMLVDEAYQAMEPGTTRSPGRKWICRGGSICTEKNHLLNAEVMLTSVQFLGLASSLANALAVSARPLSRRDRVFVRDTARIAAEHLLRWGNDEAIKRIEVNTGTGPEQVKDGGSELFFTDKPLWQITIYAEVAGIWYRKDPSLATMDNTVERTEDARMRRHVRTLLRFFSARVSYHTPGKGKPVHAKAAHGKAADLDRGYWRHYADGRYAAYEGAQKPVVCSAADDGGKDFRLDVRVPAESVPRRKDTGWDISHARRLVHALDALELNRAAMKAVYALDDTQLPPTGLAAAFANALVADIWNGDTERPLFSNYWSGANGWYRVAYDNGTGQCVEGTPPYGLSNAFPTGGYVTWARYNPVIGLLGKNLYALANRSDAQARDFIDRYYRPLGPVSGAQGRMLSRFMFVSSLAGSVGE